MAENQFSRKRKLSKAVLEMKFMKQTKDKEEHERGIEESTAMFSDHITEEMKSGANKTIIERSLARCKGLPDGRLSYHGMNPEIERLMRYRMSSEPEPIKEGPVNVDVTDQEMVNYSLQVNSAIAKKFMTKADRSKRQKFMKPDD